MQVEQAVYGEVRGGHALKVATGDTQFALSIASRLDLPDTAPPGVTWSPYVSGFPHGDRYVLARTFENVRASRSGMVLTHALIMPLAEIITFCNIEPLLGRLFKSVDDSDTLASFDFHDDGSTPEPAPNLIGAANALISQGSGPVVVLGMENFEALVASLWSNLWPELRSTFSFRLSFGPADIFEKPAPTLICTPPTLSSRWFQYRVLNGDNPPTPSTSSARILSGLEDSASLLSFARDLGADLSQLPDIQLLEHTRALLAEDGGLNNVLAAVRLVEKLSQDSSAGGPAKQEIVDRLTKQISTATPAQILAMRNLSLTGFPSSPPLWRGVEDWFLLQHFPPADDDSLIQIIASSASQNSAVEDWRTAAKHGMAAAAKMDSPELSTAAWRWISARTDLLGIIFDLFPKQASVEFRLASAAPKEITPTLAETVLQAAMARHWLALHGAVLASVECPINAARRQIAVDSNKDYFAGIRLALRFASEAEILEAAVQLGDHRLINLAAAAVVATPHIFASSQCIEITEQKIWEIILSRDMAHWKSPNDPVMARNFVLAKYSSGEIIHEPLIDAISRTPLADLCNFPAREHLWDRLSHVARQSFLAATTNGWLEIAARGEPPFVPDATLVSSIISSQHLDTVLANSTTTIAAGVRIVEALNDFSEQRFLIWFKSLLSRSSTLPIGGMEMLGRLVLARSWHRVTNEMVYRYRAYRHDLKPALIICSPMLGAFTRWRLDLSMPTLSEKWESFLSVMTDLYSTGPDHDGLWTRAGGKSSDLPAHGSGSSIWRTAVSQMRNGRGPSPAQLLHEAQQDYKSNEELRFLSKDSDIVGLDS